jgi:hypothetical protein
MRRSFHAFKVAWCNMRKLFYAFKVEWCNMRKLFYAFKVACCNMRKLFYAFKVAWGNMRTLFYAFKIAWCNMRKLFYAFKVAWCNMRKLFYAFKVAWCNMRKLFYAMTWHDTVWLLASFMFFLLEVGCLMHQAHKYLVGLFETHVRDEVHQESVKRSYLTILFKVKFHIYGWLNYLYRRWICTQSRSSTVDCNITRPKK